MNETSSSSSGGNVGLFWQLYLAVDFPLLPQPLYPSNHHQPKNQERGNIFQLHLTVPPLLILQILKRPLLLVLKQLLVVTQPITNLVFQNKENKRFYHNVYEAYSNALLQHHLLERIVIIKKHLMLDSDMLLLHLEQQ